MKFLNLRERERERERPWLPRDLFDFGRVDDGAGSTWIRDGFMENRKDRQ